MAARGSIAKTEVMDKIKTLFPDAFMNGKEFRIPWTENGERVELKLALTCAKENVGGDAGPAMDFSGPIEEAPPVIAEPTEEEKQNVRTMMAALGF